MPDPIQKGNLRDYSFAKVYYAIAGQGLTGLLDIVGEKDGLVKKRVFFLGGDSNFVKFGPLQETLGQILLRKGLVDEDQLEEAMDEVALTNKQLGQVLIEKELLTSEKLHDVMVFQTETKIVSCFQYADGNFTFKEESIAEFSHDVPMYKVNPEWIVYQGVMEHYDLDYIEKEFEHVKEKNLRLSREFENKVDSFRFLPEEIDFVRAIGEGKGFGQIVGSSTFGLTQTLRVLYSLLVTGLLEVAKAEGVKSIKVEEQKGIRRKQKAIEVNDDLYGDDILGKDDGSFASAVTDYLVDKMDLEEGEAGGAKGDLIKFEESPHEIEKSILSDVLLENRLDAIQAYTGKGASSAAAKLGELLVQKKIIDGHQLQTAFATMREKGSSFLNSLAEIGAVDDEHMHEFLSEHFNVPAVKLVDLELDQDIVSLIPQDLSKKYKVIPINKTGKTLVIAMADPGNYEAVDEIKFLTEYSVEVVVATEHEIMQAIETYHDSADMLDDVMADFDDSDIETANYEDDFDIMSAQSDSETAPVVKLVNQVLLDALAKGASDIHFEPYETVFRVRYRIDGVLYHILSPPLKLKNALVSRIKIMAKMDIAERRMPLDGRISLKMGKKKIDFRVSTLPTLWGEKLVLRILDKESLQLDLTKLGMEEGQLEDFKWCIYQPYGMILVTGPSGCGKTTTLYSSLIELNKISENISTAEDPIEYYLEGINQVQMLDEIGLNFAFTLRAFLRQDPDIIMVGEVRDFETAEISVKAALTGHVVLSTIHTNDAPSTINRLLNMGVEPFLITAAVNGVVSQRLIRKLCDDCKEVEQVERSALVKVGVVGEELENFMAYAPVGCPSCSERGFKGRYGLYEVMTLQGDIKEYILGGATPTELKREAIRRGMRTMRMTGLTKVTEGITTLSEITRTTMPDSLALASADDD